jgi:hypothetical protein
MARVSQNKTKPMKPKAKRDPKITALVAHMKALSQHAQAHVGGHVGHIRIMPKKLMRGNNCACGCSCCG